jgi:hypothetical protein
MKVKQKRKLNVNKYYRSIKKAPEALFVLK